MIGIIVKAFLCGVLDSLRGFVAIFYLDRTSSQQQTFLVSATSSSTGPPLTTLAQRRLEMRAKQSASTTADSGDIKSGSKVGSDEKPKAWRRLFSCVVMNLLCIVILHYIIVPLIETAVVLMFGDRRFAGVASVLGAFWILPVFLITRLVNALWFQDIANAAQRYRLSGSSQQQPQQQSFSRNVADFLIAILLETVFLLQGYVVGLLPVPIVNFLFSYIHVCILYSLYAFEYVWMSEGVELKQRLQRIECNWPYFFGFGCLLAAITLYPSSVVLSGCIFGVFFPVLIISSFQAKYLPLGSSTENDWQRINFFDPSVYVCEKISLHLIHRATARTLKNRRSK